jgi:hypothetical protein
MIALLCGMILLHGPNGQALFINPAQIVSVRQPRGLNTGHWPHGTNCLVTTVDGKYVTTLETCPQIKELLK